MFPVDGSVQSKPTRFRIMRVRKFLWHSPIRRRGPGWQTVDETFRNTQQFCSKDFDLVGIVVQQTQIKVSHDDDVPTLLLLLKEEMNEWSIQKRFSSWAFSRRFDGLFVSMCRCSLLFLCVAADIYRYIVFLLILLGSNISDDDRAMTFPPKEISYPEYKIKTWKIE